MSEQTLVLIKPDAVAANLIGEIITRFERAGLKVVSLKMLTAPKKLVEKHYPGDEDYLRLIGEKSAAAGEKVEDTLKQGRRVVSWLRNFITSGSVVAMVLQGEDGIELARDITGSTDPKKAKKGTIRGDLGTDSILKANKEGRPVYNLVHASGSIKEANHEIKLWFGS